MYKTLTRTLKLGLTAITILTAGVGVAFADVQIIDDFVERCSGASTQTGCTTAVKLCITNPFGSGCAATFGGDEGTIVINNNLTFKVKNAHAVAKVRYCGNQLLPSDSDLATHVCHDIWGGANAANWATKYLNTTSSVRVSTDEHRFLKNTRTGRSWGALDLSTAKFGRGSGVVLGGDVTDGVFFGLNANYYAGIFSGTDLGAPLTQTSGTAKWVGKFGASYIGAPISPAIVDRDFILEVDYATKSLDAFVYFLTDYVSRYRAYYRLDGHYDSSGIITGKFTINGYDGDRTNKTFDLDGLRSGSVTGLIGQEGAVGAFHSAGASGGGIYAGGFVARPAGVVTGAEAYLDATCGADPFHHLCFTSNERAVKILTECGANGTSSSATHCAGTVNSCVNNPFGTDCHKTLGGYALNIAKVQYCGKAGNRVDDNCTTLLEGGYTKPILERPNAANWAKEHPNAASSVGAAVRSNPHANKFVKGTATGIDVTDAPAFIQTESEAYRVPNTDGVLNFKTSAFNSTPLGGDATDGVAFVITGQGFSPRYLRTFARFYAGLFSGTDLGAPVTETSGTASWVGQFQALSFDTNQDFVLEVTFGHADRDKAGSINAFVYRQDTDRFYRSAKHYYIEGTFNNSGLITGTVDVGNFTGNDRDDPVDVFFNYPGVLTGLIGKEGAVGAFYSNNRNYAGGFVARPAEDVDGAVAFLNRTCGDGTNNLLTNGDPFHEFCYLEKDKRRIRIAKCGEGANSTNPHCSKAVLSNPCIENPFTTACMSSNDERLDEALNAKLSEVYAGIRTNRIEFCNNGAGSGASDGVCLHDEVKVAICDFNPFGAGCLNRTENDPVYNTARLVRAKRCARDISDALCESRGVTLADSCPEVPFLSSCGGNSSYEGQRLTHAKDCVAEPEDSSRCGSDVGVTTARICPLVPFGKACIGKDDSGNYEAARIRIFDECRLTPDQEKCYNIEPALANDDKKPDSATWVASRFTSENPTGIVDAPYTDDRKANQFLKDVQDTLVTTGITLAPDSQVTYLNLDDAQFNNVDLGGQNTDGVGFFSGRAVGTDPLHYYAGLFSGTDLGAPITGTADTKAIWVGTFASTKFTASKDFVLEVSFSGINNGDIAAFVQDTGLKYFLVDGEFNEYGVIDGTVTYGSFAKNSHTSTAEQAASGDLTGLIGSQGAIGAFISNDTGSDGYAGGFVARKATDVGGEETKLKERCKEDPFDELCHFVTQVDPDNENATITNQMARENRVELCITGNNAADDNLCFIAKQRNSCINNPFTTGCRDNRGVNNLYERARTNRIEFCNNGAGSVASDGVCLHDEVKTAICGANPFGDGCFSRTENDSEYNTARLVRAEHCARNISGALCEPRGVTLTDICTRVPFASVCVDINSLDSHLYEDARREIFDECRSRSPNSDLLKCYGIEPELAEAYKRPDTTTWVDSHFTSENLTGIVDAPYTKDKKGNQFLINPKSILQPEHSITTYNGLTLSFDSDSFRNVPLSGNGSGSGSVSFFNTLDSDSLQRHYYSGLNSGTYLGGRITRNDNTKATWVGRSSSTRNPGGNNFILEVTFGAVGSIEGFAQGHYGEFFHLTGDFNESGVIDGDVVLRYFYGDGGYGYRYNGFDGIPTETVDGTLTGLIGQYGAVGAFISKYSGSSGYAGGFIARPIEHVGDSTAGISQAQASLDKTCKKNPFHKFCHFGTQVDPNDATARISNEKAREIFIRQCINSSIYDEFCDPAIHHNPCIVNPFATECLDNDNFDTTRTNRIEFCSNEVGRTIGENICQYYEVRVAVCNDSPFAPSCLGITEYDSDRTARFNTCNDATASEREANSDCHGVRLTQLCHVTPFEPLCAENEGSDMARIDDFEYCRDNSTESKCSGIIPEETRLNPIADVWADSFVTIETLTGIASSPYTDDRKSNQFLKGRAGDLNKGDLIVNDSDRGDLNLETATYKDVQLDGGANNGVAFFAGKISNEETSSTNPLYYYAGLFSGTDLGAPVTNTSGTAKWVGKFAATNLDANEDFILEITFGNTDADKAGTISAFVQIADAKDFLIDGHFNARGVISGHVAYKDFTTNTPVFAEEDKNGTLTGLIGDKGAIGAFISDDTGSDGYAGGFVARPLLELTNRICGDGTNDSLTNNDPFHPVCDLESETDKKRKRVEKCIEGNNANHPGCAGALAVHGCIADPFAANCKSDSDFATARQNRINFCKETGSAGGDVLCTDTDNTDKLSNICNYAPFSPICSGHTASAGMRTEAKFNMCRDDNSSLACDGITLELAEGNKRPNAATWADSFVTFADYDGLGDKPDFPPKSQFLKGSPHWVSSEGIYVYSRSFHKNLNLSNARFKNIPLGGLAGDGVGYFWGRYNNVYFGYAGIFSGTDLGAPVSGTSGTTASWVGHIQAFGKDLNGGRRGVNKSFVLEVTFGNDDADKAGSIAAFVRTEGNFNYLLSGTFNNHGVISGTTTWANFTNRDRNAPTGEQNLGTLTGLIGQEGAVGGFHSNYGGEKSYGGGFVARSVDDVSNAQTALNTACNTNPFEDPNRELCYLEYAKARVTTIRACLNPNGTIDTDDKDCIIAAIHNTCINNPFDSACAENPDFKDVYAEAKMNRAKYCTTNLTNDLCRGSGNENARGEDAIKGICEYAPFTSICFSGNSEGNDFDDDRETKLASCHSHNEDERKADSTCHGITDNPNAVAWVNSFDSSKTPTTEPNTGTELGNQFLVGGAERLDGDNVRENHTALTLADISVEGTVTVGDSADGVAFFGDTIAVSDSLTSLPFYAGILSGTDLGAPVSGTSGTVAKWKGIFQAIGEGDYATRTEEFILEVNFTNSETGKVGKIAAFVQSAGDKYYHLVGSFNNAGVIDGTVDYGSFEDNKSNDPRGIRHPGKLTGLIGQQGAVGAFIGNMVERKGFYSGGFVARHLTAGTTPLDETCNINPFHSFCDDKRYEEKRKVMILNNCQGRPGADHLPSYCTRGGMLDVFHCVNNPFRINRDSGQTCDQILGVAFNTIVKVRYCGDASNSGVPACEDTLERPNAARWASKQKFPVPYKPDPASPKNEILQGKEDSLNEGNIVIDTPQESLNMKTATFKTNPLDGSARDGVAFFSGHFLGQTKIHYYAGMFSDTDLGAPVKETTGVASWVGSFASTNLSENKDFVLEVTFGNTTEGKGGSIAAFINGAIDDATDGTTDFYLTGTFDDFGLISGKIAAGNFIGNNRVDIGDTDYNGELAGLIGQKGAVGAFISNNDVSADKSYAGGFVARFVNAALADICNTNPFTDKNKELCYLEYVNKRADTISNCIVGDTINNSDKCDSIPSDLKSCILNPFDTTTCGDNADFKTYSALTQQNRIDFCLGKFTAGDTSDLCTHDDVVDGICDYAPFAEICFKESLPDYADYVQGRKTKFTETCRDDADDPTCHGVKNNPNAVAWEHNADADADVNFANKINKEAPTNQFIKGTTGDINREGVEIDSGQEGTLNLNGSKFGDNRPLQGDEADGVAFFAGKISSTEAINPNPLHYYAGIFSGTDLGAPLKAEDTTAEWVGKFQSVGEAGDNTFVLAVNFGARTLAAFVPYANGSRHFQIAGDYTSKGVISGYIRIGDFPGVDQVDLNLIEEPTWGTKGILTGLIGKEGAVGAFHGTGVAGGFVARPADVVTDAATDIAAKCASNPFHHYCYVKQEYETTRDTRITTCIDADGSAGDSALCGDAIAHNPCIENPFATDCQNNTKFSEYYTDAKANRITFCNNTGSRAQDSLCTDALVIKGICDFTPFASACFFEGNEYDDSRQTKLNDTCRANPDDVTCFGVKQRPNVVAWQESFNTTDDNGDVVKIPSKIGSSTRSQFLKATSVGVRNDGISLPGGDALGNLYYDLNTLTISDMGNPSASSMNQDAGVSFFWGNKFDNDDNPVSAYYAGIFGGTSLGSPLTDTSGGTAFWHGVFQTVGRGVATKTDFVLNVTFNSNANQAGSITASIKRKDTDVGQDLLSHFIIDGTFDKYGLISGNVFAGKFTDETDHTTSIGTKSPAILTGIIGQDGAVGAFVSGTSDDGGKTISKNTAEGVKNYSGGFIASPTLTTGVTNLHNYDTLPSSVLPSNRDDKSFLKTDDTGLQTAWDNVDVEPYEPNDRFPWDPGYQLRTPTRSPIGISRRGGEGSANPDGFSYFGVFESKNSSGTYVGILATTDMGAPLLKPADIASGDITAIWKGHLSLAQRATTLNIPTDFKVNLSAGTFEFSNKQELNSFVIHYSHDVVFEYLLDGRFGHHSYARENGLKTGQLGGKMTVRSATGGTYTDDFAVLGLIGQEGATAIFGKGGNVGGFTATNSEDPSYSQIYPCSNGACVETSDLLAAFTGDDTLPSTADVSKNQFLKSDASSLSIDGFSLLTPVSKITFNDAFGDKKHTYGVSFFYDKLDSNSRYYAGILANTELGKPLDQKSGDATWHGKIRATSSFNAAEIVGDDPNRGDDFSLKITFNGQGGTIRSIVDTRYSGAFHYLIDGTFNNKGIMSGEASFGQIIGETDSRTLNTAANHDYSPGTLTGIIGREGAVGAFISNTVTAGHGFAGGFVAAPSVMVTKLPTVPTKSSELTNGGFLTASDTGLDITNLQEGYSVQGEQMIMRRSADSTNSIAYNDGIAYFYTDADDDSDISRAYGGILATTNLGAPVEATQASAIWKGHHSYRDSAKIANKSTDFYVNFAAGTFEFANDLGDGPGSLIIAPFGTTPEVTFTLNALFGNQHEMAVGQLGGTLNYVHLGSSTNPFVGEDGFVRHELDVHGLIGQEGAVGVYLYKDGRQDKNGMNIDSSLVGGFVASAPTQ